LPTAHWIQGGYDTSWVEGTALAAVNLDVPAGATMKKFLMRQIAVTGIQNSTDWNGVGPLRMTMGVDIVSGEYAPRQLFLTSRRIPSEFVGVVGGIPPNDEYFQYISAGDNELGFSEQCSYGTAGGPGFRVRFTGGIFGAPGVLMHQTGNIILNFRILYFTTP
jgi:hypothetical protein